MTKKVKNEKVDPLAFTKLDIKEAEEKAAIIELTFKAFGFDVKVMEVNNFKNYTQYCFEISVGTPVEEILKRDRDLALALASPTGKIQMIAPVPNTYFVGINLPKRKKGQKEYQRKPIDPSHTIVLKPNISGFLRIVD